MSATFSERRIDIEGVSIRCLVSGEGATVIVLHGKSDAAPTALDTLLTQKFRVAALDIPDFATRSPEQASRLTARIAGTLGIEKYSLVVGTSAAAAGLCHALDAASQVEALVLVAPAGDSGGLDARLGDIKAATLILAGTTDKPTPPLARRCADRIPENYFMVVYDAGSAMANERPDALFEAIGDFIERRGRFVLERRESVLSP